MTDKPCLFFVARERDGLIFSESVILGRGPTVDGPFLTKDDAIQAAESYQDHGTYRIFKGEAVHVVKVERPQVSSDPL